MKVNPDSPSSHRTLEEELEFERFINEKRKQNQFPNKATKQYPNVERVMAMSEPELEEHRNRPFLPTDKVYVNPKAIAEKNFDAAIGRRPITPKEFALEEQRRQTPKNELGSVSLDHLQALRAESGARDKAITAFIETHGERLTPQQVKNAKTYGFWKGLDPFKTRGPEIEWVELPWYKALYHWIKGHKIESLSKEGPLDWRDFLKQKNSKD